MTWADQARRQDGVISRGQLRAHGLTDSAVTRLVASAAVEEATRGVFIVRGAPQSYAAQLWIAALATQGVLGLGTAVHLWGLVERPLRIEVLIDDARRIAPLPGVRIRRTFTPGAEVVTRSGLPVTTMRWSLMDYLGDTTLPEAAALADRALQRRWLTRRDIERRIDEYPGRRGNVTLRRLLTETEHNAAAMSERRLHRLLRRNGITGWVANHPVWVDGELVAVIDVAFARWRIALEVDGWAYHSDVERFQRDRRRQNLLQNLGWKVLRFTWADITQRPEYVLATIRAAA